MPATHVTDADQVTYRRWEGRRTLAGAVLLALIPAAASTQGLAIDHKAVGCIVAGRYARLGACFTPSAHLARSRVYFRPEGTPSWYYVDMKSDQPCHAGILPRPGKGLVNRRVEYYVEAQDKTFEAARTAEYRPLVVQSEGECDRDLPVAPFLDKATVAVFPSLPAGFIGSGAIATSTVVGVVAAGAALAGTAAVMADTTGETTTTTGAVGGNTTTTVAVTTTTSTTIPTTVRPNHPPFAVLATDPDPPRGPGPLTITFDLCRSTDPDGDPLSFFFDFGDGTRLSGVCAQTHTYAATLRAASALARTYAFEGSVVDPGGLSQTRTRDVRVEDAPPPPSPSASPCVPAVPTVSITSPTEEGFYCQQLDVPFTATATNAEKVTFFTDFFPSGCDTGLLLEDMTGFDVFPPSFSTTRSLGGDCYRIRARAFNCSGAFADANDVAIQVRNCNVFRGTPTAPASPTMAWSSDLQAEGATLQVVLNAATTWLIGHGRTYGSMMVAEGENRVEAILVEAAGAGALWRFDLMGSAAASSGIRVVAGSVVEVNPTSVTFRLKGTPSERIVFTFQAN
jgi:hypothetical protein